MLWLSYNIKLENEVLLPTQSGREPIILSGFKQLNNVPHIAQKLLDRLSQPYHLAGRELVLSGSLGIAVYPQDGENFETLMRNADMAMYTAKNSRGDSYRFFSEDMNQQATQQLELEGQLRQAIQHNEFELYYQPQVNCQTRRVTGVEALLRWQQPQMGMIPPDVFIPVAEETGLVVEMGAWVLQQACRQISAMQNCSETPLKLSVNLSGRQLDHGGLFETVQCALHDSQLPASQLELEITETILMDNAERAREVLLQLSELGIKLAIDDFGMGYSSLNYLKHSPLDRLKIDKSFLVDVMRDENNAVIVETIISMSQAMNLAVIAEGVEDQDQVSFLRDLGCVNMQGYLFSKPMPVDETCEFLRRGWSFSD
ncbi:MAG: EAL domain-containing protein, partial [Desulfuromonas sp.]|nr:EAL domain-containing protein [Desulfuromonas sp.]